jgi:hypothetical protein
MIIGIRNEFVKFITDCHIQEKTAGNGKKIFDELQKQPNQVY